MKSLGTQSLTVTALMTSIKIISGYGVELERKMKFEMQHLAFLSTLVIVFGSVVPLPNTPGGEEARTVLHVISYVACSFSWSRSKISKRKFLVLMAVLIPLTEILQVPLPYRNPSIVDLIANIAGTIIGYLASLFPKSF